MPKISIRGCRRSGTNYVAALLARNCPTLRIDNCRETWSHLCDPGDGAWQLVVLRHPQAWLCAMERYLAREDPIVLRKAAHQQWLRRTLIESWITKNALWIHQKDVEGNVSFIWYEELLKAQDGKELHNLLVEALPCGVDVHDPAADILQRVGRHDGEHVELMDTLVDRDYYLFGAWRHEFTWDDIHVLEEAFKTPIGRAVQEWTGYDLLEPLGGGA